MSRAPVIKVIHHLCRDADLDADTAFDSVEAWLDLLALFKRPICPVYLESPAVIIWEAKHLKVGLAIASWFDIAIGVVSATGGQQDEQGACDRCPRDLTRVHVA